MGTLSKLKSVRTGVKFSTTFNIKEERPNIPTSVISDSTIVTTSKSNYSNRLYDKENNVYLTASELKAGMIKNIETSNGVVNNGSQVEPNIALAEEVSAKINSAISSIVSSDNSVEVNKNGDEVDLSVKNIPAPSSNRSIKPYYRKPVFRQTGSLPKVENTSLRSPTQSNLYWYWKAEGEPELTALYVNGISGFLCMTVKENEYPIVDFLLINGGIDVLDIYSPTIIPQGFPILETVIIQQTKCVLLDLQNLIIPLQEQLTIINNKYCYDYILPENSTNLSINNYENVTENTPDTYIWISNMSGVYIIEGKIRTNLDKVYIHLKAGSTCDVQLPDFTGQVITVYDYDENLPSNETPLGY